MRDKTVRAAKLQAALFGQYGCHPTRVRILIAEDQKMTTDTQSLPGASQEEKLTKRQTPRKINRLDHQQMYKLNRWYEQIHSTITAGATRGEVATQATATLGFVVTAFNLDSTIDATGLALPPALPDAPLHQVVRAMAKLVTNGFGGQFLTEAEIHELRVILNAFVEK